MTGTPRDRIRILHRALAGGLLLVLLVFGLMLWRGMAPLLPAPARGLISAVLLAASLVSLGLAFFVGRRMVPPVATGQSGGQYWSHGTVTRAIAFWAQCEGAGMLGAVGLGLTGSLALGIIAVAAIIVGPPSKMTI